MIVLIPNISLILGDRARYPFKLRGKPLVTIPIVVAVLRKTKTQSKPTTAFSRNRPKM